MTSPDAMPAWPDEADYISIEPPDDHEAGWDDYYRALAAAWEARARLLYAAVKSHNDACVTACGEGDQAGVACGYRPYFPRKCPSCPLYEQIYDAEGRELLDVFVGPLPEEAK